MDIQATWNNEFSSKSKVIRTVMIALGVVRIEEGMNEWDQFPPFAIYLCLVCQDTKIPKSIYLERM